MQIPLHTPSSPEAYIAGQEWRHAYLTMCPLHPSGGCSLCRHGSYSRKTPAGMRIARWYCPESHRTFSLLPDFLAARFRGFLSSFEEAASEVASAHSMAAAADTLRGFEVTLPSALRWLRRRVRAVQVGLEALSQLASWAFTPSLSSVEPSPCNVPGRTGGLETLRQTLSLQLLHRLPPPLGLQAQPATPYSLDGSQHDKGPDGEGSSHYAAVIDARVSPCNVTPPSQCRQPPFRRPRTFSESGVPIAAYETAVPACTYGGSDGFADTALNTSSTSEMNSL